MARHVWVGLAALGCAALGVYAVWAQEPAPGPFRVAVVDIDAVGAKFERKLQAENDLNEWFTQQRRVLDQLSALPFLSVDEWEAAAQIHQIPKASWTQAQTDKEKELRDLTTQREREFKDLEQKATKTADEQTRFNFLLDALRARDADLKRMAGQTDQELRKRQDELGVALMAPVQAVIQKIAQEKSYALVLSKGAVFYGGDDITELVIERVNAEARAAGGGGEAPKPEGGAGEKPTAPGGGNQ